MAVERRGLGLTGIDLPIVGVSASQPFDVIGKESQTARSSLVRRALDRGLDYFATSPTHGEASRILAAGLTGYRYRAIVQSSIRNPDTSRAYREIDVLLHLFDGWLDIVQAETRAATDELLTSLARMRASGEAGAIGIECQSLTALRALAPRVLAEGIDVVSLPATLLLCHESIELLSTVVKSQCAVVCTVPDGLDAQGSAALDELKIDTRRHRLSFVSDVLTKLAVSDPLVTSVSVPVRRVRDLDRIETIAGSEPFRPSEMAALRAG